MQYVSWDGQSQKEMKHSLPSHVSRNEIEHAIDEYVVGRNAERDRAILKRRLIDGVCYEPLAEEFDISVRQLKRIVYKRINVLIQHLK